jgi:hypothetical protein
MSESEFAVGTIVLTPSGRRAIVRKYMSGASKRDCFDRVILQYEGGHARDLVTLQPHQLRRAPEPDRAPSTSQMQLGFL